MKFKREIVNDQINCEVAELFNLVIFNFNF